MFDSFIKNNFTAQCSDSFSKPENRKGRNAAFPVSIYHPS